MSNSHLTSGQVRGQHVTPSGTPTSVPGTHPLNPSLHHHSQHTTLPHLTSHPILNHSALYLSGSSENIYETAARVLFMAVKWARNIPSFLQVSLTVYIYTHTYLNTHIHFYTLTFLIFIAQ